MDKKQELYRTLESKIKQPIVIPKIYQISDQPGDKFFIINYGPPASGKGFLKNYFMEELNITNSDYINVNVDKYVVDTCKLFTLDEQKCKQMDQNLYKKFRQNADKISDDMLLSAIKTNKHIIWETTGNSIDWTIDVYIKLLKKYNYVIVLILPILSLTTQVNRCSNRQQASNCSQEYLTECRKKSYNNFPLLAKHCDIVLIYYNEGESPVLLYKKIKGHLKFKTIIKLIENDPNADVILRYIQENFGRRRNKSHRSKR